jgi:hypothetical protein
VKFRKKQGLSGRDIQLLILIGIVTVAASATLIGADIQLSRSLSGGGGFFAPWEAARSYLFKHASPYANVVAAAAQQQAYGRLAGEGENPYIPALPFFLLLVYFPIAGLSDPSPQQGIWSILSGLSDPATARGLWMFVSEAALVGTAFISFRLADWRPGRVLELAYALLSVFSLYSVMALLEGGPAILLGLVYMAAILAYCNEKEELAGALLALALTAWEIGAFLVLLFLWKALYDKRGRVLAGFGMTLLILLLVSLLLYPGWPIPYAAAILAMLRWPFGTTSTEVLARLWPAYGVGAAKALSILLVLLMFYEWAASRAEDSRRFIWTACLTLAITPLIGFRTEITNLVVLLPGMALICAAIANRWRGGDWLAGFMILLVFLLPWAWFLRWSWFGDQRAQDYLMLFLPMFTMAGLYWTRWWYIRPPRTWLDHVHHATRPAQRLANPRRSIVSSRGR